MKKPSCCKCSDLQKGVRFRKFRMLVISLQKSMGKKLIYVENTVIFL
jgi:hypothetical protein